MESKLFICHSENWRLVVEKIEAKANGAEIANTIAIYKLYGDPKTDDTDYLFVLASTESEKFAIEIGATDALIGNFSYCERMRDQKMMPVYGDSEHAKHLPCR